MCVPQHLYCQPMPDLCTHDFCLLQQQTLDVAPYRNKAKLVWVLAFVLAPYAHLLSTARHKTEAKLFIEGVMPQLLKQALNQKESDVSAQGLHHGPSCLLLMICRIFLYDQAWCLRFFKPQLQLLCLYAI